MTNRSPFPMQLRLQLPCESPVPLEGATRKEIVELLAQLLAYAVLGGAVPTDPEMHDETR
jgi:hypothetical protein